jgi:hypothetical protein
MRRAVLASNSLGQESVCGEKQRKIIKFEQLTRSVMPCS